VTADRTGLYNEGDPVADEFERRVVAAERARLAERVRRMQAWHREQAIQLGAAGDNEGARRRNAAFNAQADVLRLLEAEPGSGFA
jgi:hypothetical protein